MCLLLCTSRTKRAWCKQDVCPKSVIMSRSGAWKCSVQAGRSPLTLNACRSTQDGCCCMHGIKGSTLWLCLCITRCQQELNYWCLFVQAVSVLLVGLVDKKGANQLCYQTGFRYKVVKYDIVVCCVRTSGGVIGSSSVPGFGGGSSSSAGGMSRSSAALESGGIPSFSVSGSGAGGALGSGVNWGVLPSPSATYPMGAITVQCFINHRREGGFSGDACHISNHYYFGNYPFSCLSIGDSSGGVPALYACNSCSCPGGVIHGRRASVSPRQVCSEDHRIGVCRNEGVGAGDVGGGGGRNIEEHFVLAMAKSCSGDGHSPVAVVFRSNWWLLFQGHTHRWCQHSWHIRQP